MSHQSLSQLADAVELFRDQRDWKQFHTLKDMLISLQLEVSELMELFQWVKDHETDDLLKEKKSEVADELSDILYWVLLLSRDLNIDLEEAFLQKMEKNRQKYPQDKFSGSSKKYSS